MSRKFSSLLLVLATVFTIVNLAISNNRLAWQSVQANQKSSEKTAAPKWEYCAITNIWYNNSFGRNIGNATIQYFQESGVREEVIEISPEMRTRATDFREAAQAKAFAKLGEEGWEMVSKEPNLESRPINTFYFKRPKQ